MRRHYCYFGLHCSENFEMTEDDVVEIAVAKIFGKLTVVHPADVGKALASDEETDREDTIRATSDLEFQALDV